MSLEKRLYLYSYDANPNGSVKISSLMKYFQQIARDDLDNIGITYNEMRSFSQVFVIIKLKMEFQKEISIYDELYLKTVPTNIAGVTFFRDFVITDSDGNICLLAKSAWILINYDTRRIIRPKDICFPIPENPIIANIQLERTFDNNECPLSAKTNVREVNFSNLDENNHFNNTETASFAIDEICDRLIDGDKIKSMEIHFNHESVLGDVLEIKTNHYPLSSLVTAENRNFETNAFQCFITYWE